MIPINACAKQVCEVFAIRCWNQLIYCAKSDSYNIQLYSDELKLLNTYSEFFRDDLFSGLKYIVIDPSENQPNTYLLLKMDLIQPPQSQFSQKHWKQYTDQRSIRPITKTETDDELKQFCVIC